LSLGKLKGGAGLSIIQVTLMSEEPQSQVYDMLTEESDDEHTEVEADVPAQEEKTDKQNHKNKEKEETKVEKDKSDDADYVVAATTNDNNEEKEKNERCYPQQRLSLNLEEEDDEEEKKEEQESDEEEKKEEEKESDEEDKKEEEKESDEESDEEEKEEKEEKDKDKDDSDYVSSDDEMLTPKTKEKTPKNKKPRLIVKGSRKRVNAPTLPDMEKTDEEESDNELEITEVNEQTGFPIYKSKVSKHGQLHMNKNKLVYVTKENDTMQDVETVVSGVKFKGGCVIHIPGVEFEVYTGKPKGRPPKGKQWDDSSKQWVEKRSFNNFQTSLETLAKAVKRKLENDFDGGKKAKAVRF